MLTGRYDSVIPIDLVQQDIHTVVEAAIRAGAPAPMLAMVQSAFAAARYVEDANGDASDMPRWLAQNAGVEFVLDEASEDDVAQTSDTADGA